MIDISNLPRVDQYDPLVVGGDSSSIELPTDVKTVSYFISDEPLQDELQIGQDVNSRGGLYRRELDRAVASFSPDLASALATLGNTDLIATEVVEVQFRYFDGEEWVDEWNSDDEGGFPAAVEISVVIDNAPESADQQQGSSQNDSQTSETWRTVVNLPVAEIESDDESTDSGGGQ